MDWAPPRSPVGSARLLPLGSLQAGVPSCLARCGGGLCFSGAAAQLPCFLLCTFLLCACIGVRSFHPLGLMCSAWQQGAVRARCATPPRPWRPLASLMSVYFLGPEH